MNTKKLLTAATATGAGASKEGVSAPKTYQASGQTSSGVGNAVIAVQGNTDGANWETIGEISLDLSTTASSDSFTSDDRYAELRGNVISISGTGAAVNLNMGY